MKIHIDMNAYKAEPVAETWKRKEAEFISLLTPAKVK